MPTTSGHCASEDHDLCAIPNQCVCPCHDDQALAGRISTMLRDWIHETPMSQCSTGSDTCPDWPLAFELTDKVMALVREARR